MFLMHFLTCILVSLAITFYSDGHAAIKEQNFIQAEPLFMSREYALERAYRKLKLETSVDDSKIIEDMLYHCYYKGQPVIAEHARTNSTHAILRQACKLDSFEHTTVRKTRSRRHKKAYEHATREARLEALEKDRTLYRVIAEAVIGADDPHNTDASNDIDAPPLSTRNELYLHINLVRIYHGITGPRGKTLDQETPLYHYYLDCPRFKHFLETNERSTANAGFYVSAADVDTIRDVVERRVSYIDLDESVRLLFAKVIITRNLLETYALMRAIGDTLHFNFDEYKTADNFMCAMYAYFMAVAANGSGRNAAPPATLLALRAELFSLAYVHCGSKKVYLYRQRGDKMKLITLGEYIADTTSIYIRSIAVLFQAWANSPHDSIDPATMNEADARLRSFFVKHRHDYKQGCRSNGDE
ncbi:hypothetical protein PAPHI01_0929 [Pancytospora philotis]|nr:hypothetical protein PAPHI01_0929 [Pancytospora philotis]